MKTQITMMFQGQSLKFQIIDSGDEGRGKYYFMECQDKPEARGFFTQTFVDQNRVS